ncbi:MAG: pyridoxal phosphate-dependent aminotransferase [Motilibacteraceae bacterium]
MTAVPTATQVATIPPSGIRAVANAAWAIPDALHLEFGEPDFATPDHIVEAADRAARDGRTRYAPSGGLPALREAVCAKLARDNGLDGISPDHVLVTAGGVGALHVAYRALLDSGDEVLVPDPGWPNLASLAVVVGARPVRYPVDRATGRLPSAEHLDRLVTDRTRVIVINTPSNPLGTVATAAQQADIGAWAAARGLWVVADECYDQLWLDQPTTTFAVAAPGPASVTVFSLSKTYAMTGWRIGYSVAAPEVAARMTRVQETIASSVNTVAQWAGVEALLGPQIAVGEMRAAYRSRRDRAVARATALGLQHAVPSGAFYLWLALPEHVTDSTRFALDLLAARHVALAPGAAFGPAGEGHVRLSLAARAEDIERGLDALAEHLTTERT